MLIGYPLFVLAGYWAIGLFSSNHFDGSVEASMTPAFLFGPLGCARGHRRRSDPGQAEAGVGRCAELDFIRAGRAGMNSPKGHEQNADQIAY